MKTTANENNTNDILQTFINTCYHRQCMLDIISQTTSTTFESVKVAPGN